MRFIHIVITSACLVNSTLLFATTVTPAKTPVPALPPEFTSIKNQSYIQNAAIAGVTFTETSDKLDLVINENKADAVLPQLVAEKVVPAVSLTDIKRSPLGLSVAMVGVSFTVVILNGIYSTKPTADKLHVQAFVLPTGSKQQQLCYSFDYDRKTFQQTDWNTLTPRSFMLSAPEFIFTDWCKTHLVQETKLHK